MLLAPPHYSLINIDHGDKLGALLEQLVEQGAVTAAQDEDFLVLVVLDRIITFNCASSLH